MLQDTITRLCRDEHLLTYTWQWIFHPHSTVSEDRYQTSTNFPSHVENQSSAFVKKEKRGGTKRRQLKATWKND